MGSYRRFSDLDVTRFDRVISGKYPAWMVDHPDHTLYMVHKLRGVYDTYDLHSEAASVTPRLIPGEVQFLEQLITRNRPDREILSEFWQVLDEALQFDLEDWFAFPGPLTRRVIHFLDAIGINKKSISRFCAISKTVAQRENYFPDAVVPLVLHPPTELPVIAPTANIYLFTVSRLDAPKRIDLLIRAFMDTEINSEFRIAGTGPEQSSLKKLASSDPRVIFMGEISDQQLIQEYAGAAYVPFIPHDEDYGLVGIEAMLSAKALLTTVDAGGINEVFEQGQMGLSVCPEQASLAQAMIWMSEHALEVAEMGRAARARAILITWQKILSVMIEEASSINYMPAPRKKCVVVLTFPVWPPQNGGQSRVYNLYKEVARSYDVTLLSFVDFNKPAREIELSPGFTEIQVPKTLQHHRAEQNIAELLKVPAGDIAAINGSFLTPMYGYTLAYLGTGADLVIASHPYCYSVIRSVYKGRLWYEAHNVDYDIKKAILPDTDIGRKWLQAVRHVEAEGYNDSERTFTCSADDTVRLKELYGNRPTFVVPNGARVMPWGDVCYTVLPAYVIVWVLGPN
ncbi:MAG: glycosyltransferase [Pseudomonadales bacterium]|nr:glycosyltransferase [Pseudomonadales bacterium]